MKRLKNPGMALFGALVFCLLVLSTRLAVLLHEACGHALAAWLLGGSVNSVSVSLLGGGRTAASTSGFDTTRLFVFCLSGIFINLATGVAALWAASGRRGRHAGMLALFAGLFALVSLMGALAYLVLGLYHGAGDPVGWSASPGLWYTGLWFPLLVLAPAVAFIATLPAITVLGGFFPERGFWRALKTALLALGAPVVVYALLFAATSGSLAAADAPETGRARERHQLLAAKKQALAQRLKRLHPGWTDRQISRAVDRASLEVTDEEIEKLPPLLPVLAALVVLGGGLAVSRGRPHAMPAGAITENKLAVAALLAAAVLGFLALTGGVVYPPGG